MRLQLFEGGTPTDLTSVSFNATGEWQSWTTVSEELELPAGLHRIRLLADAALFNINWLNFTFVSGTNSVEESSPVAFKVFPNPVGTGELHLSFADPSQVPSEVTVYNAIGALQFTTKIEGSPSTVALSHQLPRGQYFLVFEVDGHYVSRFFAVQ